LGRVIVLKDQIETQQKTQPSLDSWVKLRALISACSLGHSSNVTRLNFVITIINFLFAVGAIKNRSFAKIALEII
jgi:hypothetical protein